MKPYEVKTAKLCFSFPNAQSALYFPLDNTVPEIVLRTHCNKPVNPLPDELFSVEVTFSLYIPSSVGFSAPKLHTSALTAILYTFVTQTTPTQAIVTALSRQPLAQTGINASPLEMDAVQGKRTVFSTHLCIGGQQWPI